MSPEDISQASMLDLYRLEAEGQTQILTAGLLVLERNARAGEELEACMRAAHSLKGAARIVGISAGVRVAHAMEDCFVAAQRSQIELRQPQIDALFRGVDLLRRISRAESDAGAGAPDEAEIDALVTALRVAVEGRSGAAPPAEGPSPGAPVPPAPVAREQDRALRVTTESLNRLFGLAGESRVEAGRFAPFVESLLRLRRMHAELCTRLGDLQETLSAHPLSERERTVLANTRDRAFECQRLLGQRVEELEQFDIRNLNLSHRLYEAALECRMRPFADGTRGLARMVRDLSRALGKQARLEISGQATQVDRDILERLEAPLGHLLRNAVDHGIEAPQERLQAGKPAEGVVHLEARHSAGLLHVTVADDGRGIAPDALRAAVVQRGLTDEATAARLGEAELHAFLFLPGFTLRETVTDISGRGVGLDVVQDMLKHVRGTVRVFSQPGAGTRFQLQLPLTLSVVRSLLVEIDGEPYALPLAHIVRALRVQPEQLQFLEGRPHIAADRGPIGLVAAGRVLGREGAGFPAGELPVVLLGAGDRAYGVVVDGFLGERELVVHPLDARLGKIKDIAAAGLMEDGSPLLIIDVEDLTRSIEKLAAEGSLGASPGGAAASAERARKRVLVVEDSLTVRELERKLLVNAGYEVEVATDGMDGWNAVRAGRFDLVITDVDMPRMDGIELVQLMKKDPRAHAVPVMIVSYKDRPEDRRRGLEAGADYYLAKASFHDDALLQAVVDLVGGAAA